MHKTTSILMAFGIAALAGCSSSSNSAAMTPPPPPAPPQTMPSSANPGTLPKPSGGTVQVVTESKLAAPDIGGVLVMANQGEIDQARAALPHLTNQAVRDFANMMIADHSAALQSARASLNAANITPRQDSAAVVMLTNGSKKNVDMFNGMTTSADRAYMQAMVDAHSSLLSMLDTTLIPASRGDLLNLLQSQRAAVAMHLDRARSILSSL